MSMWGKPNQRVFTRKVIYIYFRLKASQQSCHISIRWKCPLDNLPLAVFALLATWASRHPGGLSVVHPPPGSWQVPKNPLPRHYVISVWTLSSGIGMRRAILPVQEDWSPFRTCPGTWKDFRGARRIFQNISTVGACTSGIFQWISS